MACSETDEESKAGQKGLIMKKQKVARMPKLRAVQSPEKHVDDGRQMCPSGRHDFSIVVRQRNEGRLFARTNTVDHTVTTVEALGCIKCGTVIQPNMPDAFPSQLPNTADPNTAGPDFKQEP